MAEIRIRDLPDDIHHEFRIICVKKKVSMNKELIRMIKKEVEKHRRDKL